MQNVKQELHANPVGANCVRPHFKGMPQNKGITLIALIITIIVMLILVGVTINVALNGGLFGKGEKAAFQTGASAVKEQLEIEKASRVMENGGKQLKDYSGITVGNLAGLDAKTIEKYGDIIVVDSNGDICYNPANVTEEEKAWLEEIGIRASSETRLNDLKKLEKYLKSSVIYDENDITNSLLDITKEPPMFKGKNPINDAETSIEMSNIEFNEDGTIDAWIKYNANSENNNIYIVNGNFEAKENGEPKKITFNSIRLYEPIVVEQDYLLYEMRAEDSGGKQMMFVDRTTKVGTVFFAIGDMFIPFPIIEFRIKDTFEYEGETKYNVLIVQSLIDSSMPEEYGGEIDNENLSLKGVDDSGSVQVLEAQKLPIESKNIIGIYETEDITDFSGTGMNPGEFKKCYGLLESGECYHLYKAYNHYFIISNGTVNYTIENGILKAEQIDKDFVATGEFKDYTIGTEAIKVK